MRISEIVWCFYEVHFDLVVSHNLISSSNVKILCHKSYLTDITLCFWLQFQILFIEFKPSAIDYNIFNFFQVVLYKTVYDRRSIFTIKSVIFHILYFQVQIVLLLNN